MSEADDGGEGPLGAEAGLARNKKSVATPDRDAVEGALAFGDDGDSRRAAKG